MPAAEADATGGDWAICCSGGGIRSAAHCLGALQNLDRGGVLGPAKWIVGVSGGSYIASSRALVAHDLPSGTVPHAYAPGTPEERNLRNNTRYIAPNGATMLVGVLSLLLGAIVTFILVVAPIYALTHAWGWLLRWQGVLVPSGPRAMTAEVTGTRLADAHGLPEQGDIWVCKLGWWNEAPWDVLAYAKDHSTYPCDSTLEQLYDAAEFEAYRELGEAAAAAAAKECEPPMRCPVTPGRGSPPVPRQLSNASVT